MSSTPSPREQEVLDALAQGHTTRAIATALGLSVKTVETHTAHLRQKLGLRNIREVIVYACAQRHEEA